MRKWVYHLNVATIEEATMRAENILGSELECRDPWRSQLLSSRGKPNRHGASVGMTSVQARNAMAEDISMGQCTHVACIHRDTQLYSVAYLKLTLSGHEGQVRATVTS